jgi:hypothetical protein
MRLSIAIALELQLRQKLSQPAKDKRLRKHRVVDHYATSNGLEALKKPGAMAIPTFRP